MTATETLAQYQALAEKATQGPWEVVSSTYGSEIGDYEGAYIKDVIEDGYCVENGPYAPIGVEDGAFIAASRTLGPAMAAALQEILESWPGQIGPIITKHLEGK